MKWELSKYICINKECGYTVTDSKNPDARRCLKCGLPMNRELTKNDKNKVMH